MAVKKIVQYGDEHLKRVSDTVVEINEEIRELIQDLKDTLSTVEGIGLAAPQIAVNKRVILIDLTPDNSSPLILINPKAIIVSKETARDYEGCLSYVGYEGLVERPTKMIVEALNENGKLVKYEVEDFMARVFCHEMDHLEGILYMEKADEMYELVEGKE
ncbi:MULTISPECIES: peptide deformylase [unclassified Clostridium]|uniref:peptide deformylase n=1 Tax=unclassified Clostridium TaxID=2614128 RepID=UPI0032164945